MYYMEKLRHITTLSTSLSTYLSNKYVQSTYVILNMSYILYFQLNLILKAPNHPVNDHGIPGQIEIAKEYDEYFSAIEDYTKEYGKLELSDIRRFVKSHEKISKKLDQFVERVQY